MADHEIEMQGRGQRLISWVRIDSSGNSKVIEEEKVSMMHRCDLPARDLRLLDPLFSYPSTILGREKAIVVKLEEIRCIITADVVFLVNNRDDHSYVQELWRRLQAVGMDLSGSSNLETPPDDLPFEFRALEVALDVACSSLDSEATNLVKKAYPLLEKLTSNTSTSYLEGVRELKSRLVALTKKVEKVRDEMEELMDDDDYMAEMCLTEKRPDMETSFHGDQSSTGFRSREVAISVSAPVSPIPSPPESRRKLEKSWSIARKRHGSRSSSGSTTNGVEKLEMLLEAYFVLIDGTLNKLTELNEYIDDTEDFINMQLDRVRNQLMKYELLLTTAAFIISIFGMVTGVFGMNFELGFFEDWSTFKLVLVINGACSILIFGLLLWFLKSKQVFPLG